MRIYLDVCAIQRQFDDASQERILHETEALLRVIKLVEQGVVDLVSSYALEIETEANPDAFKRGYMERVLSLAEERVIPGAAVQRRTDAYRSFGLDMWDAAHLAAAVEARVDFFCTCDDKLLRRARKADTGLTRAVSLLELIEEVER
jgi:hypothetical protein